MGRSGEFAALWLVERGIRRVGLDMVEREGGRGFGDSDTVAI